MNQRPLPTGPYAVGTTTYTVYTDREELRAPGTRRSVPVRVYYPTSKEAVAGLNKARYMSRNVAEGLKSCPTAPSMPSCTMGRTPTRIMPPIWCPMRTP